MDQHEMFECLGGEPTATFGCANPAEIVGPLNPRSVQYGITYGNDERGRVTYHAFPTVYLNFNKFRPDLPPWRSVKEFILATLGDDGDVFEATFIDVNPTGTSITGDLKTVTLVADAVVEGTDAAAIIEKQEVAEDRGMATSNVEDGSTFKVTEELR